MSTQISVLKNGPLKIEGDIAMNDSAGKSMTTTAGKAVFLCRCGLSANKPFCDGQHSKQGFVSDVASST
jgi:CDGSH-type Zn-finger protein